GMRERFNELEPKWGVIPSTEREVAETFFTYWGFIPPSTSARFFTPDFQTGQVTFFCTDHAVRTVRSVVAAAERFIADHPLEGAHFRLAGGMIGIMAAVYDEILRSDAIMTAAPFAVILLLTFLTYRPVSPPRRAPAPRRSPGARQRGGQRLHGGARHRSRSRHAARDRRRRRLRDRLRYLHPEPCPGTHPGGHGARGRRARGGRRRRPDGCLHGAGDDRGRALLHAHGAALRRRDGRPARAVDGDERAHGAGHAPGGARDRAAP